jgi:hypothetical protein
VRFQSFQIFLDSRLRGSDGAATFYEPIKKKKLKENVRVPLFREGIEALL